MSITPTPSDNDDDFDIYGDLAYLNVNENTSENKSDVVKSLEQQVLLLQSENESLRNSNKSLSDLNKNLSCNISILYKTAAEEIKRKDKAIEDLTRELDSYFFRRNGRKPPDRGSKNVHPLNIDTLKEACRPKLDDNPPIHSSSTSSEGNTQPDDTVCTKSSRSRECTPGITKNLLSPGRKDAIPDIKAEKIIKEVPKKRKVIENIAVDEKPVDDATSDRKMVLSKLSVSSRLGYQESTTLPADKTSTNLSVNLKEISEPKMEKSITKLSENKECSQQTPCTGTLKLSDSKPEKASKQVEPLVKSSSKVEATQLRFTKAEPSLVDKPTELPQGPIEREDPVCEPLAAPFKPLLATNEDKILPENVPFQPPLPHGDPLPPPPLPSSTPPPTPVKILQHEESKSNLKGETLDHKNRVLTGLLLLQNDQSVDSTPIVSDNTQERKQNNRPRWSDENLHMQCPFKPRRRAKSVVVVEDAVDNDIKINLKDSEVLKVETSSSKSSEKSKRTPLKKSDNQENRLSSEFRPYQTQRSVHSNRHLSLKSYVHFPERRSPSELLNGRSGRIARIYHQDKVRARFHDRRSRSLSPQKKRLREDEQRTKIGQRTTSARDGGRRIVTEDNGAKIDRNQGEIKSKPSKKKTNGPKEEVDKVKQKIFELFGESSPEPEEKNSKRSNRNLKSIPLIAASTLKLNSQKEEVSLPSTNSGSSLSQISLNNMNPESDIIVIKRRPRSSIKLGNSEDAAPNSRIFTIQTSEQESLSCSTPLSKDGNGASGLEKKSVKPAQAEEQGSKQTVDVLPVTTPLYFRERGVKRGTSDDSAIDEDLIGESEESVNNADSDETYNPKVSLSKSRKQKPSKRKR